VAIAEKDREGPGHLLQRSALQSLLITAVIVITAAVIRFIWIAPDSPDALPITQLRNTIEEFMDRREVQNLHFALEAHRLIKGTYPEELSELVSMDLVTKDQIANKYGVPYPYMYVVSEDRYVLSP
jgi:hypothetical protein